MLLVKLKGVVSSGLMLVLVACGAGGDDVAADETGLAAAEVDSVAIAASPVAADTGSLAMSSRAPADSRPAAKAPVEAATTAPPPRPAAQAATPPTKGAPVETVPTPTPTPTPPTPPAAQPPAQGAGLYTAAQASRGEEVYAMVCSQCHMPAQHSGPAFATTWNGRRVFDLYDLIANSMPMNDPGSLSNQEYVDVVAYILKLNAVPAGSSALRADEASLKQKRIEIKGPARQ